MCTWIVTAVTAIRITSTAWRSSSRGRLLPLRTPVSALSGSIDSSIYAGSMSSTRAFFNIISLNKIALFTVIWSQEFINWAVGLAVWVYTYSRRRSWRLQLCCVVGIYYSGVCINLNSATYSIQPEVRGERRQCKLCDRGHGVSKARK